MARSTATGGGPASPCAVSYCCIPKRPLSSPRRGRTFAPGTCQFPSRLYCTTPPCEKHPPRDVCFWAKSLFCREDRRLDGYTCRTWPYSDAESRRRDGYAGGCQPAATHSRRTMTAITLFNCKAITVARPHGVRPSTCIPSALHAKCSAHRCRRGSNSRTSRPVNGSCPCVRSALKPLHMRQASHRLASSSDPPWAVGMM